MIYVVIGQSGAGKTTFVKKHFLTGAMELIEKKYPVPVTKCGDVFAIGRYGIGIHTEGTDTTARNALPKIIQRVRRLVEEKKSVLMEGDRCCGVPPEWNVSQTGQIGQAIIIAREKGHVKFSDIAPQVEKYFGGFEWTKAASYNTGSNKSRAQMYDTTMAQFVRANWNNLSSGNSPARGYGGILTPDGVDENGDVIYRYTPKQ